MVYEILFLVKKLPKIAYGRKVDFWVIVDQQHPAVHTGELARGRSVAFAVGVNDMWQVTCNTGQATCKTWHMTHDTWHLTPDIWFLVSIYFLVCFGFLGRAATICTRQEIQCLPYCLCCPFSKLIWQARVVWKLVFEKYFMD